MSATTKIEWADKTWGPVRGCSRVGLTHEFCTMPFLRYVEEGFGSPAEPEEGVSLIRWPDEEHDYSGPIAARGSSWGEALCELVLALHAAGRLRLAPPPPASASPALIRSAGAACRAWTSTATATCSQPGPGIGTRSAFRGSARPSTLEPAQVGRSLWFEVRYEEGA